MGKYIKKRKRQTANKKKKIQRTSTKGINFGQSRFYQIFFIVAFLFLAINFLFKFSKLTDTTNDYINENLKWLIPFEYGIFAIISGCIIYFVFSLLRPEMDVNIPGKYILTLSFLAISSFYILSFTEGISSNGDNAEYMITAKSLVERGGAYRLYTRNEAPNPLASVGLPLMLAPIYYFRGFDFLWMKILIMALGLCVFPLLFMLFRQSHNFALSALMAIACFSSPYLVSGSTNIMTETPYLFWSVLAILLAVYYSKKPDFDWKYAILVLLALIMTYLTRANGIAAFMAVFVYLILRIPWKDVVEKQGWRKLIYSPEFRKFIFLAAPLLVFGIVWQFRHLKMGVSQASFFFSSDLLRLFPKNAATAFQVISQVLFSDDTFRWANMEFDYYLEALNVKWISILILLLLGIVSGLMRKSLMAIYTVLAAIMIFFGSVVISHDVITRYLSILLPFCIYFFVTGTITAFDLLNRLVKSRHVNQLGIVISMLLLSQLVFANFSSNSYFIAGQNRGFVYSPGFQSFLNAAKWCKNFLPPDSYIVSRKPRIFYLYSNLKGVYSTGSKDTYSEEFEKQKLETWKSNGATHLILDVFNLSTQENIRPIVKNNQDKFKIIHVADNGQGPCYVLELNLGE